jgi:diadenosine tetraphosphate (Ap4A) HIT family hydrolase
MSAGCPFCDKLSNLAALPPSEVVWEMPHSVAFLGRWQLYCGYCVLVARRHATELSGLEDAARRGYLDEMCFLARAIEETFRPVKLNYELLGNQVPHLHWHIFPRYADDPDARRPVWFTLDEAEKRPELLKSLETGRMSAEHTTVALRQALARLRPPRT